MTDAVRTTSLAELRRRIARRLGDLVRVQGTETGSTSTLVDAINIPTGNEDLTRRQMVFTSTDFAGVKAVITSTDPRGNEIPFRPILPATTPSATTADIFNKRGAGFSLTEYKDAINDAIDDAYPLARVP